MFKPLASLLCGLGDAVNKVLQMCIIGSSWYGDEDEVIIDPDMVDILEESKAAKFLKKEDNAPRNGLVTKYIVKDYVDSWNGSYILPNFKLTPAEIFSGNVSALDANFFKTNSSVDEELGGTEKSIVTKLKDVVSQWYVALRNIAIVGLLSVLLYIGIRIVISSSAEDKAKYKQFFVDWVVSLCLIFFLHYIMAFTMTMSETITDILAGSTTEQGSTKQLNIEYVNKDGDPYVDKEHHIFFVSWGESNPVKFASNFTGLARIKAQYSDIGLKMGYTIIYLALTFYTIYFTFIYLKRLLYLAFFTMIAPLVSLTYPLDKMKDGKAQAFNFWFKEYIFYALLQPIHMLLYRVFVSSAIDLVSDNLIYAIVALSFIVPAEKLLKQMFGIKGQTESNLGGFAGGALASHAFSALKSKVSGGGNKGGGQSAANNNKIRQAKNPNSPNAMDTLASDAAGLDSEALAASTGATIGAGAGAAMAYGRNDTGGSSAADAYQNTPDPVRAAEREALEEKLADGQLDKSELSAEQRALLGMQQKDNSSRQEPPKDDTTPADTLPKEESKFKNEKNRLKNNAKKAIKQRYVSAGGWQGIAKKGVKGLTKGVVKASSAATLGTLGLAAGIVGGDMGDTIKGLGAGVAAGTMVGNRINNSISSPNTAIGRFTNDVLYGDEEGRKKQFMQQYMSSSETASRILEKHPDMSIKEVRAQQEAEAQMIYDTGIDDYSTISGALQIEKELVAENKKKNEGREADNQIPDTSHNMAVTLAKLSQNYDKSTFTDYNKTQQAQVALKKRIESEMNKQPGANKRYSAEYISKQADAEATKTLEQIRRIKKLDK